MFENATATPVIAVHIKPGQVQSADPLPARSIEQARAAYVIHRARIAPNLAAVIAERNFGEARRD